MTSTFYRIGEQPLTDADRAELAETLRQRRRDCEIWSAHLARARRGLAPQIDAEIDTYERLLAAGCAHVANIERALATGYC